MARKTVSAILMALLALGTLTLVFKIQQVRADSGTIYINADGSISPTGAPVSSLDNITYTFTDNISVPIVIERNNITVEGAGHTVQGPGTHYGITLSGRSNVTIKNMEITNFFCGISVFLRFKQHHFWKQHNKQRCWHWTWIFS